MTRQRWANLAWQLGHDAAAVQATCDGADVAAFVEARTGDNEPVDVAAILEAWQPGQWRVWQDTSSGAAAGSVIAARRTVRARWWSLLQVSPRGRKVQERMLRTMGYRDDRGTVAVGTMHSPLPSTELQDEAMRATRQWVRRQRARRLLNRRHRWVLFADGNMPHTRMRKAIGAPYSHGADVSGVFWSEGWSNVRAFTYPVDYLDHVVVQFDGE